MPGLFGWIGLDQDCADDASDASATLAEMSRRMSHSGDEVVETWTDPGRAFAIARIAPRHLRPVAWPADSAGDELAFVDGVLHGDAAQIDERVHDLARRGHTALASLRGFFTAARWEPARRRLLLAVDRRASRPLAYTVARGRLYFAPEIKALLAVPGFDKTLDDAALGLFLGAGYTLAEQTLFAAVRRLAGGEALIVEHGRHRIEPYYRYALCARGDGTRHLDLEIEMADLVRAAVERNLADTDTSRTIVFLSGGVDSRAIAEAAQGAARRRGETIRTVTWASPRSRPGSDLEVARRVADLLGTRHRAILRRVGAWGAHLAEVTYLLDGLTDVPAYHAYEHTVMRDLAANGARVVLRGDECFGWMGPVASLEEAWLTLNLRALGPLRLYDRLVRPALYPRWCDASAAALAGASLPFRDEHPDDAKDQLYFRHRLQSYLGSAAYLKHVVLDHRAPLLDEALLDLNARVPAPLRCDKRLFLRAVARGAPELWRIPFAGHGNLEDWEQLLTDESPVRAHIESELRDRDSGIWALFDPAAIEALLPPLGAPPSRRPAARLEQGVKAVARTALRLAPNLARRIATTRHRQGIRIEQAVMRVMVLKTWHDLFVTGDGSRRALEARKSAAPASSRAA